MNAMFSRGMFLAVVLLATAVGASPAHAAEAAASRPSVAAASLGDQLAAEVGRGEPVAVLAGPQGLLAVSADGKRRRQLQAGPIAWAIVDNRAQVIWFGDGTSGKVRAQYLDLTLPAPSPRVVLDTVPGSDHLGIRYEHPHEFVTTGSPHDDRVIMVMNAKRPRLEPDASLTGVVNDGFESKMKRAVARTRMAPSVITGLRRLAVRGAGRGAGGALNYGQGLRVDSVPASACADSDAICGEADALPGTALWRVLVADSCGDGCYPVFQLYDPKRREFIDIENPSRRSKTPLADATNVANCWLSPDSKYVLLEEKIYRLAGGTVVGPTGSTGGGWLHGGWRLE